MTSRILVGVIVVATALFVTGVSLEKSKSHDDHGPEPATQAEAEGSEEGAEAEEVQRRSESEGDENDEGDEATLLGVDLESTPLIVLAVVVALCLAAATWIKPGSAALLLAVGLAMLAFAVLDVREVAHQLDESKDGVALLAALVALLHGVAAVIAIRLSLSWRLPRPLSP